MNVLLSYCKTKYDVTVILVWHDSRVGISSMIVAFPDHCHCFGFNINLSIDQSPKFPIQIQNLQHVKFVTNPFIKLMDNL